MPPGGDVGSSKPPRGSPQLRRAERLLMLMLLNAGSVCLKPGRQHTAASQAVMVQRPWPRPLLRMLLRPLLELPFRRPLLRLGAGAASDAGRRDKQKVQRRCKARGLAPAHGAGAAAAAAPAVWLTHAAPGVRRHLCSLMAAVPLPS